LSLLQQALFIFLGIASIACAILLILGIPERLAALPPDRHKTLIYGTGALVGFCVFSAILSFFPQSHFITLRIAGAIGLAGCIFILVDSFHTQNFDRVPITLLFWLPGSIYLIMRGKMSDEPRD
jgi:uncharacterized membrane protein HdeD (DUF308 family)